MNFQHEAAEEWKSLEKHAKTRCGELSEIFSPVVDAVECYEKHACRVTLVLGHLTPVNKEDEALRDLFAEAYDSLAAAKCQILIWQPSLVLVLLRRAFEIVSLMAYFTIERNRIKQWESGKRIEPAEVRKVLGEHEGKHMAGEPGDQLRAFYKFFSRGTHVNRKYVPGRRLGKGHVFTLGSISTPILGVVAEQLLYLLNSWFWLGALISMEYFPQLMRLDPDHSKEYQSISCKLKDAIEWLRSSWNLLHVADEADNGKVSPNNEFNNGG